LTAKDGMMYEKNTNDCTFIYETALVLNNTKLKKKFSDNRELRCVHHYIIDTVFNQD